MGHTGIGGRVTGDHWHFNVIDGNKYTGWEYKPGSALAGTELHIYDVFAVNGVKIVEGYGYPWKTSDWKDGDGSGGTQPGDEKKKKARQARWQSIAESAAKQSKRNIIPEVSDVLTYKQTMAKVKEMDLFLVPYENARGMAATRDALNRIQPGMSVGILIGPEGGFDPQEIAQAQEAGAVTVSLGQRILRAETAAVTAVALGMLHVELNLGGDEA